MLGSGGGGVELFVVLRCIIAGMLGGLDTAMAWRERLCWEFEG